MVCINSIDSKLSLRTSLCVVHIYIYIYNWQPWTGNIRYLIHLTSDTSCVLRLSSYFLLGMCCTIIKLTDTGVTLFSSVWSRQRKLQAGWQESFPERVTRWRCLVGKCRWSRGLQSLNASGMARRRSWSPQIFVHEVRTRAEQTDKSNFPVIYHFCSEFSLKINILSIFNSITASDMSQMYLEINVENWMLKCALVLDENTNIWHQQCTLVPYFHPFI